MERCCPYVPAARAAFASAPSPSCRRWVAAIFLPILLRKIFLPYFQTTPNLHPAVAFLNYLMAGASLHEKPSFRDGGREVQRCL